MQRINVNVPSDVRTRLREMAERAGRTEGELVRELLVDALDRARREEFYSGVAAAHTAELRERDLEVAPAFEKLGG